MTRGTNLVVEQPVADNPTPHNTVRSDRFLCWSTTMPMFVCPTRLNLNGTGIIVSVLDWLVICITRSILVTKWNTARSVHFLNVG